MLPRFLSVYLMKVLLNADLIQGSPIQSQRLNNEIFARMKYPKSSTLVDKDEPAQITNAPSIVVTEIEPTTQGDKIINLISWNPCLQPKRKHPRNPQNQILKKPKKVIRKDEVSDSPVETQTPQRKLTVITSSQLVTPPPKPIPQSSAQKKTVVSTGYPSQRVEGLINTPTPSPSTRATSLSHHRIIILYNWRSFQALTKNSHIAERIPFFTTSIERQLTNKTTNVVIGITIPWQE